VTNGLTSELRFQFARIALNTSPQSVVATTSVLPDNSLQPLATGTPAPTRLAQNGSQPISAIAELDWWSRPLRYFVLLSYRRFRIFKALHKETSAAHFAAFNFSRIIC